MGNIKIKAGSNGQFLVRYKDEKEAGVICKWLEERGYNNKFGCNFNDPPHIIVVDSEGYFFRTNITCMAGAVSCSIEIIDFDKLKALEGKLNK